MAKKATQLDLDIYNTLFEEDDTKQLESEAVEISLKCLHEFVGHPFRVVDDENMYELANSIAENGVLYPILVRPEEMDSFEIIAGHRRKRASELAGKDTIPCIILDITHQEAVDIMIDTNIQRPNISVSEKAFAFRLKMEAAKNEKEAGRTDSYLAEKAGVGRSTVQRYIRLTYLTRELLDLVDSGNIGITTGESLSYLETEEQETLTDFMKKYQINKISGEQAEELKEFSKRGLIVEEILGQIFEVKKQKKVKVILKEKELKKFFPDNYTQDEMQEIILELLGKWADNREKGEK